jgi:anti-anti-sigma factor
VGLQIYCRIDAGGDVGGTMEQYLDVRETVIEDRIVLVIEGELDLYTAPVVTKAIDAAADRGAALTLDLRPLRFIDASGVSTIVAAHHRLEHGRGLSLIQGPPNVQRVFELCGLIGVLRFVAA